MSAMEPDRSDDGGDDFLAAEFALGVLPGVELAALARRAEMDPAFARAVADWEERLVRRRMIWNRRPDFGREGPGAPV
jgi:anti-sigma-K factor RskA